MRLKSSIGGSRLCCLLMAGGRARLWCTMWCTTVDSMCCTVRVSMSCCFLLLLRGWAAAVGSRVGCVGRGAASNDERRATTGTTVKRAAAVKRPIVPIGSIAPIGPDRSPRSPPRPPRQRPFPPPRPLPLTTLAPLVTPLVPLLPRCRCGCPPSPPHGRCGTKEGVGSHSLRQPCPPTGRRGGCGARHG